jgi:hypothetical protein
MVFSWRRAIFSGAEPANQRLLILYIHLHLRIGDNWNGNESRLHALARGSRKDNFTNI